MLKSNKSLSKKEKQNMKKNCMSNKRSRKVASQAFFFMGTLFLTFFAGSINRFTQLVSGKSIYTLLVLHCVFSPSQGFFNFLVYVRPRMIQWYEKRIKRDTTARWSVFSTAWIVEIFSRTHSPDMARPCAYEEEDDDEYVDMYNEEEITDDVKVKASLPTLPETNRDNDHIAHDKFSFPLQILGN